MSLNVVMILGNLGKDLELKRTNGQVPVINLRVATTDTYTNREGAKQERTEWHDVVAFGNLAEHCHRYLEKGGRVFIEGRLQTRTWQDTSGRKRYATEVLARNVHWIGRGGVKRDVMAAPPAGAESDAGAAPDAALPEAQPETTAAAG